MKKDIPAASTKTYTLPVEYSLTTVMNLSKNEKNAQEISKFDVGFIVDYSSSPVLTLRLYALQTVKFLMLNEECCELFVSGSKQGIPQGGILPAIIPQMKSQNENISQLALFSVRNIAKHSSNETIQKNLVAYGTHLIPIVLPLLESDKEQIQKLSYMVLSDLLEIQSMQDAFVKQNGVGQLLTLCVSESSPEEVANAASTQLNYLLDSNEEIMKQFIEQKKLQQIIDKIESIKSPQTQANILGVLANILISSEELREEIYDSPKALKIICSFLSHSSSICQKNALRTIVNLTLTYQRIPVLLNPEYKLIENIHKIMQSNSEHSDIALSVLTNLTSHEDTHRYIIKGMNGLDSVNSLLQQDNPKKQLSGLKLLTNFAVKGRNRKWFHENSKIPNLVEKLKSSPNNDISTQAESALANLSFPYESHYDDEEIEEKKALPEIVELDDDDEFSAEDGEEGEDGDEIQPKSTAVDTKAAEELNRKLEEERKAIEIEKKKLADEEKARIEAAKRKEEREKEAERKRLEKQKEHEKQLKILQEQEEKRKKEKQERILQKQKEDEELRKQEQEAEELRKKLEGKKKAKAEKEKADKLSNQLNELIQSHKEACEISSKKLSEYQSEVTELQNEISSLDKRIESVLKKKDSRQRKVQRSLVRTEKAKTKLNASLKSSPSEKIVQQHQDKHDSYSKRVDDAQAKLDRIEKKHTVLLNSKKEYEEKIRLKEEEYNNLVKNEEISQKQRQEEISKLETQVKGDSASTTSHDELEEELKKREKQLEELAKRRKEREELAKQQEIEQKEHEAKFLSEQKALQEKIRIQEQEESEIREKLKIEAEEEKRKADEAAKKAKAELERREKEAEEAKKRAAEEQARIEKESAVSATPTVDPREKMRIRRGNIVREILDTEKTYVTSLRTLVWKFQKPMERHVAEGKKPEICSKEDIKVLFSNIEMILNFNKILFEGIQQRLRNWSDEQLLGDIFMKLTDFLRIYVDYVNNFDNAMRLVGNFKKTTPNKEFIKFITKTERLPACKGLSLESFLIMPVQRVPRYVMLLMDLLKNTWEDHPDYKSLSGVLAKMKETGDFINESKRNAEAMDKMHSLGMTLTGKVPMKFIQPHRKFIREGDCKLCGKWNHAVHLILVSDMLLISKPMKHNMFDVKNIVGLVNIGISKVEDKSKTPNRFKVSVLPDAGSKKLKDWIFSCTSPKERDDWFQAIYKQSDTVTTAHHSFIKSKSSLIHH